MTDKELREEETELDKAIQAHYEASFLVGVNYNNENEEVANSHLGLVTKARNRLLSLFQTYSKKREEEIIEEIRAYLARASKQLIKDSAKASPGKWVDCQERASCCRDLAHILKYQYEITILGGITKELKSK